MQALKEILEMLALKEILEIKDPRVMIVLLLALKEILEIQVLPGQQRFQPMPTTMLRWDQTRRYMSPHQQQVAVALTRMLCHLPRPPG